MFSVTDNGLCCTTAQPGVALSLPRQSPAAARPIADHPAPCAPSCTCTSAARYEQLPVTVLQDGLRVAVLTDNELIRALDLDLCLVRLNVAKAVTAYRASAR